MDAVEQFDLEGVAMRTETTEVECLKDAAAVAAIASATGGRVPLVIHGGSGVPVAQRARLARETPVVKFNIGTEVRQVFGRALRDRLAGSDEFDRIAILSAVEPPLVDAARDIFRDLAADGRA